MLQDTLSNHLTNFIKFQELAGKIHSETLVIIAVRLKNYLTIQNLIGQKHANALVQSTEGLIGAFLRKNLKTNFSVAFLEPYYFIFFDGKEESKKIFYALESELVISHHAEHNIYAQFIATHAMVAKDEKEIINTVKNMVTLLESDRDHSGIVEYTKDTTASIAAEYAKLNALRTSLQNRSARFAYQPIIDCSNGNTAYYECLLRIPDDKGELISAGPSILLAEKYGMINSVDIAALELAVREITLAKDINLSVNISNMGILDERLLDKAKEILKDPEIASRLIIEITETSVNEDIEKTSRFIDTVKALGCRIAIDDFGAGVTSLKQLSQIDFDIIKIDGSLIRDIVINPYNKFLVGLLVKLAQEVGAKTVAEFVENGEIAKFLLDSKVDFLQGNFFSPAQNFRTWSKK